ncbi:uncharacterized protein CDV56_103284 [Aspergillus thermomutatus]|uniref:Mid2 domain-containing protein n=1 Tax=Aspergillus thermomutatus TaxID=41047 RepID=A0A397GR85_ASPTH|nr:uncharacterized protein CDV56_103284 [Aspergillus thermomutatus]RHZ53107.1 hypothetical protein CDV56_103284 [Aspergillus thermomutatus]
MRWSLAWTLFLPSISIPVQASRTCYLPNGEVAINDQPCFPENPESSCCGGSTYVCATNNMCAYYDASYYVIGSCTDKTWNSPACDHIHNTVFRCSANTYCCVDGPACNCTTGVNTQHIADFLPEYSELVGSSVALDTVATSSLLTPIGATRTPATTVATVPATSSSAPGVSGTSTTTLATTPAATHLSTSTTSSVSPTQTAVSTSSNSLKIGLGVGIPLGALAVALVVVLLIMQRRWRRRQVLTEMKRTSQQVFYLQRHPERPPSENVKKNPYLELRQTHIFEAPGHEAARI